MPMGWTWKHIAGFTALAFTVWITLYAIEWSIRTGGSVSMGDALLDWLGRAVMLQWVHRYQGLGAGILAFAAGAFVYANGAADRKAAQANRSADRYVRSLAIVMRLRERFYRINNELIAAAGNVGFPDRQSKNFSVAASQIENLDGQLMDAYNVGSEFGAWLAGATQQVRDAFEIATKPGASADDTRRLAGFSYGAWLVLKDPAMLLTDDGSYRRHKTLLSESDQDIMRLSRVTRDDLWASRNYLMNDW
jgi:hypothetical protein